MGALIAKIVINAIAVFVGAYLLRGVELRNFAKGLIVALVLAVLNATLGSFLDFITTPLRWLTLGLFSLVVDAIVLMVSDYFIGEFKIKNFWWAIALAVIVGITNGILGPLLISMEG